MKKISESLEDKVLKYIDNLITYNIYLKHKENKDGSLYSIFLYLKSKKKYISYPNIILNDKIDNGHDFVSRKLMYSLEFLLNYESFTIDNNAFDIILDRIDRLYYFLSLMQENVYTNDKESITGGEMYLSGLSCLLNDLIQCKSKYYGRYGYIIRRYNKKMIESEDKYILNIKDLKEMCKTVDLYNNNRCLEIELSMLLKISKGRIRNNFDNKNNLTLFYIITILLIDHSFGLWVYVYISIINYKYIKNEDFKKYFLDKILINKNIRNDLKINIEKILKILPDTEKHKLSEMIDSTKDIFRDNMSLNDMFKPINFFNDVIKDISNKNIKKITIFTEK